MYNTFSMKVFYFYLSVVGLKRVKVLMKRGGTQIIEHMKKMIEKSQLVDEQTQEEKGETAVFLFLCFLAIVPNWESSGHTMHIKIPYTFLC